MELSEGREFDLEEPGGTGGGDVCLVYVMIPLTFKNNISFQLVQRIPISPLDCADLVSEKKMVNLVVACVIKRGK